MRSDYSLGPTTQGLIEKISAGPEKIVKGVGEFSERFFGEIERFLFGFDMFFFDVANFVRC